MSSATCSSPSSTSLAGVASTPRPPLRAANQRFYDRFTHMEAACRQQGVTLADLSMEAREALWQEAKRRTTHDQSPAG